MATPQELLSKAAPASGSSEEGDGLVRHYLYSKSDIAAGITPGIYRQDKSQPDGKLFVNNLGTHLVDLRIKIDSGNEKHNIEPYYFLEVVVGVEHEGSIVPVASLKVPFEDQKFGDIVNRLLGGDPVMYQSGAAPISISLYASKRMDSKGNPYASIGVTEEAYTQSGYEWKYSYDEVDKMGENPRTAEADWRPVRIFWIKKFITELMPMFNGGEPLEVPRHPALVKHLKSYMDKVLTGKTPAAIGRFTEDLEIEFKVKIRHPEDLVEVKRHFDDLYVSAGGKDRPMGSTAINAAAHRTAPAAAAIAPAEALNPSAAEKFNEFPTADPKSLKAEAADDNDLPF